MTLATKHTHIYASTSKYYTHIHIYIYIYICIYVHRVGRNSSLQNKSFVAVVFNDKVFSEKTFSLFIL